MKVDVVIPARSRSDIKEGLLEAVNNEPMFNNVIVVTDVQPLSKARFEGCKRATTEWVAMFDDDVSIPPHWLQTVSKEIDSKTGAVATVRGQNDSSVDAYHKVISAFYHLHNVDSNPHIGNVLVRRSLMLTFQPTPIFTGEDQYLRNHIESSGYAWKILPYIGVVHMRRATISVEMGVYYKRFRYYSRFQLLRRLGTRLILGSFTPLVSHSLFSPFSLWKDDVKFVSGWLKETYKSNKDSEDIS